MELNYPESLKKLLRTFLRRKGVLKTQHSRAVLLRYFIFSKIAGKKRMILQKMTSLTAHVFVTGFWQDFK